MNATLSTQEIWELLSGKLRSFISSRVPDQHAAGDLLQETFLRVHKNIDQVQDQQRLSAWVFQIARNLIIDFYRSSGRGETGVESDAAVAEEAANGNLNGVVMGWLPAAIDCLPETYREAVRLYELEGTPQQEIAERLGVSLTSVKSRVRRGRAKLKQVLLECCTFELDRRGNVLDYTPGGEDCCQSCEKP